MIRMSKSNYGTTILFYFIINFAVLISARDLLIYNRTFFIDFFNNIEIFSVVIIGSFFLTIFIHECGHLIVGKLLGFSLIEICVWIFRLKLDSNDKLKFSIKKNRLFSFNGYTFMNPSNTDNFLLKQAFFLSGGFLLNIMTFVIIILLLQSSYNFSNSTQEYLLVLAYISIIIAFINSLPISFGESLFDGRKISNLFLNTAFKNCLLIDSLNIRGVRPKNWLDYDVFDSFKTKELTDYDFLLKLYELFTYIDLQNKEKSYEIIKDLLNNIKDSSIQVHDTILLNCAIYYSFVDYNVENVKLCINSLKHQFHPPLMTRAYIEVIQSQVNQDKQELELKTKKLLDLLSLSPFKGIRIFYKELLLSN